MTMKKEIGKNTLGGGHKMAVDLKTYNRSTHDLSYIWRNTQSPGTLVPFMKSVALPGDIRDIDLEAKILTHPTVGPLYGSYKLQLDVFTCPIRLYISALHNNSLKVGMNMSKVKLPKLAINIQGNWGKKYSEWGQVNPSALLSYLGINGFGVLNSAENAITKFNGVPALAYWDIFKNYYANKQEENAYFIKPSTATAYGFTGGEPGQAKTQKQVFTNTFPQKFSVYLTGASNNRGYIGINVSEDTYKISEHADNITLVYKGSDSSRYETLTLTEFIERVQTSLNATSWSWLEKNSIIWEGVTEEKANEYTFTISKVNLNTDKDGVKIESFPLSNIDDMREDILQKPFYQEFIIDSTANEPYKTLVATNEYTTAASGAQCGLALKTYQSDLFNNWINTEWIDGENGINDLTAVSTEGGSFTIDALNIAQKVYNMLNRIALSDGTYRSWLETVWTNEYVSRCESPVYEGGLSQEIVFDEVVSTAGSTAQGDEPLGTLAGRGGLMKNRKGGSIRIKIDEPCYIIGIVSITPRLDYSQGNDFDVDLDNMDDWHKPELDAIGFQDLPASWAAWSERKVGADGEVTQRSFGKQPAWVEYMTNFNRTKGNFAINDSEAFMVLNRNYTIDESGEIQDATTYIDPVKYNYVFADTNLDAMNFWVQIGVNDVARRKMSAKIIPNL